VVLFVYLSAYTDIAQKKQGCQYWVLRLFTGTYSNFWKTACTITCFWCIMFRLSHPILATGRGENVLLDILIAVMVGIAVHYIIKRLDSD